MNKKLKKRLIEYSKKYSCFKIHEMEKIPCKKQECKFWSENVSCSSFNCVINESKKGPKTLQEVGDIFNVTRMRICQIEKKIVKKLSKNQNKIYESFFS